MQREVTKYLLTLKLRDTVMITQNGAREKNSETDVYAL